MDIPGSRESNSESSGEYSALHSTLSVDLCRGNALCYLVRKPDKGLDCGLIHEREFSLIGEAEQSEEQYSRDHSVDKEKYSSLPIKLTPFHLKWSFGYTPTSPVLNLTNNETARIFFASSHAGVLYNYHTHTMKLLQGHKNPICCLASDSLGRWIVTADKGEDSVVIVWDSKLCVPVNTIYNVSSKGVKLVGMSPRGKYLIILHEDKNDSIIELWQWTLGKDEPDASVKLAKGDSEILNIVFKSDQDEYFCLTLETEVVFITYEENRLQTDIPNVLKSTKPIGSYTSTTYITGNTLALTSTLHGYVIVWCDSSLLAPPGVQSYGLKAFMKKIQLQPVAITLITSIDNLIVTGNELGHITFYEKKLKILYWCQNFSLDPIVSISFHLEPRRYEPDGELRCCETIYNNKDNLLGGNYSVKGERKLEDGLSNELELLEEDFDYISDYEKLYKVPSDVTLLHKPFFSRDFVINTISGKIAYVNYSKNCVRYLLYNVEQPFTALEVHPHKEWIIAGNASGRIYLFEYNTMKMLVENKINLKKGSKSSLETSYMPITALRYDRTGSKLACGLENGSLTFLDPTVLTYVATSSFKNCSSAITKIIFSDDSEFLAHMDISNCVSLYKCDESGQYFYGKYRAHYKPIRDIVFTATKEMLKLYSIAEDRMLVEYDVCRSGPDNLKLENSYRIEQSASPLCLVNHPDFTKRASFLLTSNSEYKFKLVDEATKICCKTVQAPILGSPITAMTVLPSTQSENGNGYVLYTAGQHIGIQLIPIDGNPFKSVSIVGAPTKVINMCVSADSKYLFTIGENDTSVLMWNINASAVDILSHVGGLGLDPYYCLLEGGFHGWLFQEIKDLFYYAQIRHQGEHVVSTRDVSCELSLCEVPDLMRAIGFYPTLYEIEEMIQEVTSESCNDDSRETSFSQMNINFETFVRLYINHRPALGISLEDISNAFNTAMMLSGEVKLLSDVSRRDFLHVLYDTGEPITPEDCNGYFGVLLGLIKSELMDKTKTAEDLLPQNITLEYILNDILGGDNWEEGKKRKGAVPIYVPR